MKQCKMVKIDDLNLEDWQRDSVQEVQNLMDEYKVKRYVVKEYGVLQDSEGNCIHVLKLEDEGPDIMNNEDPQHAIALYDIRKLEDIAGSATGEIMVSCGVFLDGTD